MSPFVLLPHPEPQGVGVACTHVVLDGSQQERRDAAPVPEAVDVDMRELDRRLRRDAGGFEPNA
jgi:hypothetical protein